MMSRRMGRGRWAYAAGVAMALLGIGMMSHSWAQAADDADPDEQPKPEDKPPPKADPSDIRNSIGNLDAVRGGPPATAPAGNAWASEFSPAAMQTRASTNPC